METVSVQRPNPKEGKYSDLLCCAHLQRNNNMYRKQDQGQVGQHVDDTHALPEGNLREALAVLRFVNDSTMNLQSQCSPVHGWVCAMDMCRHTGMMWQ